MKYVPFWLLGCVEIAVIRRTRALLAWCVWFDTCAAPFGDLEGNDAGFFKDENIVRSEIEVADALTRDTSADCVKYLCEAPPPICDLS